MKNDSLVVLQINAVGKTLSTGRTTWEMHEFLKKNGIDSYIATARGDDCEESYAISSLNGIRIDRVQSFFSGLYGYNSKLQTYKLLKYIESIKPDIVHLRNLHEYYVNLGDLLQYLAKNNIATVITLHDSWFMTGRCCLHKVAKCDRWQTGCGNCPLIMSKKSCLFDRTKKMWADKKRWFESIPRLAVVGNSKWTLNEAKKSFLQCAQIVEYIYNWVDFSTFYPRQVDELRERLCLSGKKVIMSVSTNWSFGSAKGLDTFWDLAKNLPQNFIILLVGNMVQVNEFPQNILNIPFTNSVNELAELYSLADVYLNLSESETFGKAAAEAVSCGVPLITRNTTANPEIVPPNAGVILNTCSVNEILSALDQIFSKPKQYYCDFCLDYAIKNFDKDTNLRQYLNIYRNLVEDT